MKNRFERTPDLPFQKILDEVIILVPRERRLHRLNEAAALLWLSLDAPRTADDLASTLLDEYEIDDETARSDARTFLREMEEKGLVVGTR